VSKWFRKLRLRHGFFTMDDILHAIRITGNAKDRDDFEWKLKMTLDKMSEAKK